MADFGIYWKNFAKEGEQGDWPCLGWFTNSERLARQIQAGDRLWLFTTGDACDMPESKMGYLVQLFVVESVAGNPGSNHEYPPTDFAFFIRGSKAGCIKVDPPLLVDTIIREPGTNTDLSIGKVRQSPWKMKEEMASALRSLLKPG